MKLLNKIENGAEGMADIAQRQSLPSGILSKAFWLALSIFLIGNHLSVSILGAESADVPSTNSISTAITNAPESITNSVAEDLPVSAKEAEPESSPQKTNSYSGQDLASFKIINDRNIFNMNRSPRSSGRRSAFTTAPKTVKIDSFSLVGTLSSDKGQFAFFDGSSSDYRKVLKVDGIIAGYKVAQIDTSAVKLEAKGKEIELNMGAQMRRQNEGDWQILAQTDSYATGDSSSTTKNMEPSSGPASDVLKRLMEQREKELNK